MDPTDIVKVPYDLERLCLYVASVVVVLLATALERNWRKIPGLAVLTLLGHGVIVLCGASPLRNPWHTLTASLYTTALILFDPPIFGHDKDNDDESTATASSNNAATALKQQQQHKESSAGVSWYPQLQLLLRGTRPKQRQRGATASSMQQQQRQDKVAMAVAHSVAACLIPCQILLLYDHGMQIQRWPVPIIMASTYGWAVGLVVGTLWAILTVV
jgi:hypothetical protein